MQAKPTTAERGYGAAWRRARAAFLQRHPMCVLCEARGRTALASVVDHVRPHRLGQAIASGDPQAIAQARRLFWDRDGWQALCKACHDGAKQSADRTGSLRGADVHGMPLDPAHPWRRRPGAAAD